MSKVLRHTSRILWVLALIVLTAATATKGQTQVPDARVDVHLTLRSDGHDAPLLVSAVRDGDVEAVRSLLRQGAYANAAEGDGLSTLHWAARSGEPEIAKILLDAGATVDARTRNGAYTPLHEASKAGNASVARVLLEAGADPAARTTAGGATPLHFAAISGSAAAVEVLLESGAEIDPREGESEQTPLTWAAASNHLETVSALLDGGADPNAATKVVDVVKVFEDVRKARELYEKRKKSGDAESDAGVVTAEDSESTGDEVEQSEPRVLTFADLVSKKGGLTPFLLAARQGHRDVVMRLLDVGADINHQAAEGSSPLLIATINGHFDLGLELLERGADPNLPAHSGIAPLYAALNLQFSPVSMYPQPTNHMEQEIEYRDYMRALLEAGADPNARLKMRPWFEEHMESKLVDPSGATPLLASGARAGRRDDAHARGLRRGSHHLQREGSVSQPIGSRATRRRRGDRPFGYASCTRRWAFEHASPCGCGRRTRRSRRGSRSPSCARRLDARRPLPGGRDRARRERS